jgi:hypothetical protein
VEDRRCLVQFLHPGGEHSPDDPRLTFRSWNRGNHKRMFLKSPGQYMDGAAARDAEVFFWGEWEAQSRIIARMRSKKRGLPRYLHEPFLDWRPKPPQLRSRPRTRILLSSVLISSTRAVSSTGVAIQHSSPICSGDR